MTTSKMKTFSTFQEQVPALHGKKCKDIKPRQLNKINKSTMFGIQAENTFIIMDKPWLFSSL